MRGKAMVLHPFMFALYPILFLYSHNAQKVPAQSALLPMLISLAAASLIWGFLFLITRNAEKAGILTSAFMLFFFSYGHARRLIIKTVYLPALSWLSCAGQYKAFPLIYFPAFLVLAFLIIKSRKETGGLTRFLNIASAALVIFALITASSGAFGHRASERGIEPKAGIAPGSVKQAAPPNIYYIILDAYAAEDVLSDIYGYEDSGFLDYLKACGFYIAGGSNSNYSQTVLSLVSSLNFDYFDGVMEAMDGPAVRPEAALKENKLFSFLRRHGYRVAAFSSGTFSTDINTADIYLKTGGVFDEFQNRLIGTTPIPPLLGLIKSKDQFDIHRGEVRYILGHLGDTAAFRPPVFVFAHIKVPHPPFVFDSAGNPTDTEEEFSDDDGDRLIKKGGMSKDEYVRRYAGQIAFVNAELRSAVDEILAGSANPPVIILQGDHGPRSGLVWDDPAKTDFRECMSILNAYYTAGRECPSLYAGITPVNTFRVILNRFFGTELPLLEDKILYSTEKAPYVFYDVTEQVRERP